MTTIAKATLVELFLRRDDLALAERADSELPDPVDLEADADALRSLGINPGLLATQVDNLER